MGWLEQKKIFVIEVDKKQFWGIFSKNQFHVSRGHSLKTEILNYSVLINLNFKGQMPIHNQF